MEQFGDNLLSVEGVLAVVRTTIMDQPTNTYNVVYKGSDAVVEIDLTEEQRDVFYSRLNILEIIKNG